VCQREFYICVTHMKTTFLYTSYRDICVAVSDFLKDLCVAVSCSVLQCVVSERVSHMCDTYKQKNPVEIWFRLGCSGCEKWLFSEFWEIIPCSSIRLFGTPQHTKIHCNTLHILLQVPYSAKARTARHCNTLHQTATHCNTLQHDSLTPCNTLEFTATHARAYRCVGCENVHMIPCNRMTSGDSGDSMQQHSFDSLYVGLFWVCMQSSFECVCGALLSAYRALLSAYRSLSKKQAKRFHAVAYIRQPMGCMCVGWENVHKISCNRNTFAIILLHRSSVQGRLSSLFWYDFMQ